MPLARIGDITLYWERRGAGPPLLFITGTGHDLRRPPNALERALAGRFGVLQYDQRGMGRSAKPDRPYAMADYAQDAAGLLRALGWRRGALLGYSFGGMVAQELALREPALFDRLVLLSTSSGGAGGASAPVHEWAGLPVEARARRWVELTDVRRDAAWQARNPAMFAALVEETAAGMRLGADDPQREAGRRRQLDARRGHDAWDRLPQLALPVHVFGGRYDGVAAPARHEALAARIPGARLALFEGGHLFFLQDPKALPAILEALGAP